MNTTDVSKEILEKYELLEKIGEGGMGRVFKVRHRVLQRFDVCKVIHSKIFLNDEQKKKFIREARVSSNLKKHKNIVSVFGAGGEEDFPYILFEYVKGVTLEVRIKEAKQLPIKEAIFYAKEICEGLSYAHSMGIIHRDIKSENVILSDQIVDGFPVPKIADFGIATIKGEAPKVQKSEWALHGTPSYMSPEQAAGEEATEQSDIYSLGIIFYEMLTGSVPFKGQTLHQVIMQHISEPPKPVHEINPEVPIQVSELVHRAIEKKPQDRYPSADDFAAKLEKALSFADRWQRGMITGGNPSLRGKAPSSCSFPKPAVGMSSSMARTGRRRSITPSSTSVSGRSHAAGASVATTIPPSGEHATGWLGGLFTQNKLQITVAMAVLSVVSIFLLYRTLGPGSHHIRSSLAYTPRDLRVVQGQKDALVNWKSDAPYISIVEFGIDEQKMTQERGAGLEEVEHTVKLSNLATSKKYQYRIIYPTGEKSLPYSFSLMDVDLSFWMSVLDDKGVRVEGEASVPAKAVLTYEKNGQELVAHPQEGEGFETSFTFKLDGMNSETDKIRKISIQFSTGEEAEYPGAKVKMR